jgi:hypothetical protein
LLGKRKSQPVVDQQEQMFLIMMEALLNNRSTKNLDLDKQIDMTELKPVRDVIRNDLKAAIQRIIDNRFFSICPVDSLLKMHRITPDKEVYELLRSLHCVDWRDMEPDLRKQVQLHLVAMFAAVEGEL